MKKNAAILLAMCLVLAFPAAQAFADGALRPFDCGAALLTFPSGDYDIGTFLSDWANGYRGKYYAGVVTGSDVEEVSLYICDIDEEGTYTYWCGEMGRGGGRSGSVFAAKAVDIGADIVDGFEWIPQRGSYWTWVVVRTGDGEYSYYGDAFTLR